jgi:uncharacterized membrane protein
MRTLLLAVLLMLIGTGAQAQLTLCNRTGDPILAASAVENGAVLSVVGWTRIAPNACVQVADNNEYAYAYYAYQPGSDWVWEGEEEDEDFCVEFGGNFRINYRGIDPEFWDADSFDCPSGAEKRRFTVLENDFMAKHTIDLD